MDINQEEIDTARKVAKRQGSYWHNVDAEEIEADLFLWLCENNETVQRYRFEEGGAGKLYMALRHRAYDFMGKELRAVNHTPARNDGVFDIGEIKTALKALGDGLPSDERTQLIVGAFYGLKPKQQEILRLVYVDGLSPKSIALNTGRTYHAIKTWRTKAMGNLKSALSGLYYDLPESVEDMVFREAL